MEKSKKFRMPSGIRNKLMAAIAMLLVSSIMMVSSTYAWFTLSTAPEVTGITTSVGANGNLEMALLNGKTFGNTGLIASAVGDSSAVKDVKDANITWGNLVDLSDISYGLNLIALNPAALNYTDATTQTAVGTTYLQTAVYGADGRVAKLEDNTITGVYDSTTAKWVTKQTIDSVEYDAYGVRAIGVDSSLSTAQIVFNAATAAVNSGNRNASSAVTSAVVAHQQTFLLLAMSIDSDSATYDADDYAALKAVAEGVDSSLKTIVKTYSNAILAKLATTDLTDEELTALRGELSNVTLASSLKTKLETASVTNDYTTSLDALATAQEQVATVLGKFTVTDGTVGVVADTDVKEAIIKPLIGTAVDAYKADGSEATISGTDLNAVADVATMYLTEGLVATVAAEAGTYEMCRVTGIADVTVFAGAAGDEAKTGNLDEAAAAVAGLTPPSGENAEQTIADFYGYVIDFAFRTNATGSSLQLQTTPANRVYSDAEGENLATQGAGSTATFAFDPAMTSDQVTNLLDAIRIVFIDPVTGTIYGNGVLTDVEMGTTEATANVRMAGYETADKAPIVDLAQNIATKISVLVYLDGNEVDNADVANSASSGMLNLNLQFSSSAELIPMSNTALETMTAYTVSFNANGGTGYMPSVKASGNYAVPANIFTAAEGKQFKGWAKTATIAADTELVTTLELTENTTLYAIWEDVAADPDAGNETTTYTVTLKANYPAGIEDLADVTKTVNQGETYTLTDADLFAVSSCY